MPLEHDATEASLLDALGGKTSACPPAVDWEKFVTLATRHRVIGHVLRSGPSRLPQVIRDRFFRIQQANVARSLHLFGHLVRILAILEKNRIHAIPFKGPLLAWQAYGDLSLRSPGDLDLLIHRHQLPAARTLLMRAGFVPGFPNTTPAEAEYLTAMSGAELRDYLHSHAEHHLGHERLALNLDLHWAITLREQAIPIDTRRLWEQSRRVSIPGGACRSLSPEHAFMVLCVNAAKDGWTRLDRLCDVRALLLQQAYDTSALIAECRRSGTLRLMLATTAICQRLFHTVLPNQFEQLLSRDSTARDIATDRTTKLFLSSSDDAPWEQITLQWRLRDQVHTRFRYLFGLCAPTVGDMAALPLPAVLRPLLILLRPLRLGLGLTGHSA